jgi:hypothetical protein
MNENSVNTHPYALEVGLAPKSESFFRWTIRKGGKVFQRSDRDFTSEEKARAHGFAMIERLLAGAA